MMICEYFDNGNDIKCDINNVYIQTACNTIIL